MVEAWLQCCLGNFDANKKLAHLPHFKFKFSTLLFPFLSPTSSLKESHSKHTNRDILHDISASNSYSCFGRKSPDTLLLEGLRKRAATEALRLLCSILRYSSTHSPFVLPSHRTCDHYSEPRRPHGRRYESALLVQGLLGPGEVKLWEVSGLFLESRRCSGLWNLFVEIDSYAIALSYHANGVRGNSMGLILDARSSLFSLFGSIAYGKRGQLLRIGTNTLGLSSWRDTGLVQCMPSQKLCQRSWTPVCSA